MQLDPYRYGSLANFFLPYRVVDLVVVLVVDAGVALIGTPAHSDAQAYACLPDCHMVQNSLLGTWRGSTCSCL